MMSRSREASHASGAATRGKLSPRQNTRDALVDEESDVTQGAVFQRNAAEMCLCASVEIPAKRKELKSVDLCLSPKHSQQCLAVRLVLKRTGAPACRSQRDR